MANAKKCDRCGRLYDEPKPHPLAQIDFIFDYIERHKPLVWNDLCEECTKSLRKWWKNTGERATDD